MLPKIRISPFLTQCVVSGGVSFNMATMGSVMGFSTVLLPQLRQPGSIIAIDDQSSSLIAAFPSICVGVGNFVAPPIMSKLGRRIAVIISLIVNIIGWLLIFLSYDVTTLLAARAIQGLGMGLIATAGPVLIGEYSSPRYRGAFLMTMAISISVGVLVIQTLGSYFSWVTTAIIAIGINVANLLVVLLSPESPTFLAEKAKYDACRKTFLYLRGDNENEELEKIIEASAAIRKENDKENISVTLEKNIKAKLYHFRATVTKKEFYKSVLIMLHVYAVAQWCGVNMLTCYTIDLFTLVVGTELDMQLMVVVVQIHRTIASCLGIALIMILKRRTMVLTFLSLNLAVNLCISVYTFSKAQNWLMYDHPAIGITLIHIQMFSAACGAMPLSFVLAGEIFPMEMKSLCGGICSVFFSINMFINIWVTPMLFRTIGIHGAFWVHCSVMGYCMLYIFFSLPETKNRTLQDIEKELKGKKTLR